ncbi:MAG: hypothetical protein AAF652_02735 [Cyanobacteria bacterium P01_C01_bin.72]
MTTIVKHRRTGNEYILLGINPETNKANPSRFINELFNQEKSEVSYSATVCDAQGNIFLAYIDDLMVIEIDGVKPAAILPEVNYQAVDRSPSAESSDREFDEREFDEDEFDEDEFGDEEFSEETASEPRPTIVTPPPQDATTDSLDAPQQDDDDDDWI